MKKVKGKDTHKTRKYELSKDFCYKGYPDRHETVRPGTTYQQPIHLAKTAWQISRPTATIPLKTSRT